MQVRVIAMFDNEEVGSNSSMVRTLHAISKLTLDCVFLMPVSSCLLR